MNLKAVVWKAKDWIYVAQDTKMTDSFEHRNEHSGSLKCREIRDYLGN